MMDDSLRCAFAVLALAFIFGVPFYIGHSYGSFSKNEEINYVITNYGQTTETLTSALRVVTWDKSPSRLDAELKPYGTNILGKEDEE